MATDHQYGSFRQKTEFCKSRYLHVYSAFFYYIMSYFPRASTIKLMSHTKNEIIMNGIMIMEETVPTEAKAMPRQIAVNDSMMASQAIAK